MKVGIRKRLGTLHFLWKKKKVPSERGQNPRAKRSRRVQKTQDGQTKKRRDDQEDGTWPVAEIGQRGGTRGRKYPLY